MHFVWTQKRLDYVVLSFIDTVRSVMIETVLHFDCEVVIAGNVQSRSVTTTAALLQIKTEN